MSISKFFTISLFTSLISRALFTIIMAELSTPFLSIFVILMAVYAILMPRLFNISPFMSTIPILRLFALLTSAMFISVFILYLF